MDLLFADAVPAPSGTAASPAHSAAMAAPDAQGTDYVLLRAEDMRLLLPREQIGAPEYLEERLSVFEGSEGTGLFCVNNDRNAHVYMALSGQMKILLEPPAERFVVTPIRSKDGEVRWCWNEVQLVARDRVQLHPLAAVLMASYTPITHFAEIDGHLAFLSSADRLLQYALAVNGGEA